MDFEALVRDDYTGQRWIIVTEIGAGTGPLVDMLRSAGVSDVFLLFGNRGVGELPDVPTHELGTTGATVMEGIRAFEDTVLDLPAEALAALDRFDPDRTAAVLFAGFGTATRIGGRTVFAPRQPRWAALEDKIAALDLWQRAGIPTAPAAVVPAEHAALAAAHADLDQGLGTVWVADNRTGWHGGGEYLRRIRDTSQVAPASEFMERHAHRVRVMPFLDGLPCSIHGFVTSAGVAVFRPVEMLIFWRDDTLVYGGVATTWDPAHADREEMRGAARAVGLTLRDTVGYRGGYSLDGVMTGEGFRPTEINPRLSVGLAIQVDGLDGLPLGSLVRHLQAHPDAVLDLDDLETRIVSNADSRRSSRAMFSSPRPLEDQTRRVTLTESAVVEADEGPIELSAGPSLHGGIVFLRAEPGVVAPGASFAPVVAACAPFVETWLEFEIGILDHAVDVRT